MALYLGPNTELPWESSVEEDKTFKRLLRGLLIALLVLGLIVPFVPLPEVSREEKQELPPQMARVILEKEQEPPPPPPEPEPEPEPEEPEPEEEPEPAPEPEPEPEPEPPPPPPPSRVQEARETASRSGLMQHRDALAAMRDTLDTSRVEQAALSEGQSEAERPERNVIEGQVANDSGGITTDNLSRDTGGGGELAQRQTTQVTNEAETLAAAEAAEEAAGGSNERAARSDEQIRQVIDQHMGGIFAIYNRELRSDPLLKGKLVVRMVIEPSGEISEARVISSELNNETLEQRLLARILLITFPDADVTVTQVNYTFDFLPR